MSFMVNVLKEFETFEAACNRCGQTVMGIRDNRYEPPRVTVPKVCERCYDALSR